VPIIIPILVFLPYAVVRLYGRSVQLSHLVDSLSQGTRDLEVMTRLLDGPMAPFVGEPAEDVQSLEEPDFKAFEILQDSRILDMRNWNPAGTAKDDADSLVYGYRRVKFLKRPDISGNNVFRMDALATHTKSQVRFPRQDLQPKLRKCTIASMIPGEKMARWEVSADISELPAGEMVDLAYEHISPGQFLRRGATSTSVHYDIQADTAEVTRWFLLPRGKEYKNFRVVRWERGKPEKVEPVKIVNEYLAEDYTILAYKLLSVKGGYTHEVTWFYK
jgi:hypothetical protein